ncbi:hypothetical protein CK203_043018 [Vitis vinifera]|uniref:Uncharacterized protein n=1 Tax=Vitis vinifera TaxID=29760 RepID=A0A438H095_VITVI|nr:hypothetical protein CK203_043018 [Vitis vinifera]
MIQWYWSRENSYLYPKSTVVVEISDNWDSAEAIAALPVPLVAFLLAPPSFPFHLVASWLRVGCNGGPLFEASLKPLLLQPPLLHYWLSSPPDTQLLYEHGHMPVPLWEMGLSCNTSLLILSSLSFQTIKKIAPLVAGVHKLGLHHFHQSKVVCNCIPNLLCRWKPNEVANKDGSIEPISHPFTSCILSPPPTEGRVEGVIRAIQFDANRGQLLSRWLEWTSELYSKLLSSLPLVQTVQMAILKIHPECSPERTAHANNSHPHTDACQGCCPRVQRLASRSYYSWWGHGTGEKIPQIGTRVIQDLRKFPAEISGVILSLTSLKLFSMWDDSGKTNGLRGHEETLLEELEALNNISERRIWNLFLVECGDLISLELSSSFLERTIQLERLDISRCDGLKDVKINVESKSLPSVGNTRKSYPKVTSQRFARGKLVHFHGWKSLALPSVGPGTISQEKMVSARFRRHPRRTVKSLRSKRLYSQGCEVGFHLEVSQLPFRRICRVTSGGNTPYCSKRLRNHFATNGDFATLWKMLPSAWSDWLAMAATSSFQL